MARLFGAVLRRNIPGNTFTRRIALTFSLTLGGVLNNSWSNHLKFGNADTTFVEGL